jgi:hypothetical protein
MISDQNSELQIAHRILPETQLPSCVYQQIFTETGARKTGLMHIAG